MARIIDLTSKRFTRLIVLKRNGTLSDGSLQKPSWLCKCDCGKELTVRGKSLRSKQTLSCGCYNREATSHNNNLERDGSCILCGKEYRYCAPVKKIYCSKKCADSIKSTYGKNFKKTLKSLLHRSKTCKRVRNKELRFDLDYDFLLALFRKQSGRCSKTGVKFVLPQVARRNPWSPSIDRIDSSKGYTKDNIQLVCWIYNISKYVWDDKCVTKFAKTLINKGVRHRPRK